MNKEIIKKYKDLLGDKGHKEYYFDINDKVINITTEDIIYGLRMYLEINNKLGFNS